jgi:hypothetical protein
MLTGTKKKSCVNRKWTTLRKGASPFRFCRLPGGPVYHLENVRLMIKDCAEP